MKQATYDKRRAAGLCVVCEEATESGFAMCKTHREQKRVYQLRAHRIEAGKDPDQPKCEQEQERDLVIQPNEKIGIREALKFVATALADRVIVSKNPPKENEIDI